MTVKVLVVDDSAFMRAVVSRLLSEDGEIEVIGTARNGRVGLDQVLKLTPDVVTMDVEMPEMNGIEAVKSIMKERPTPIVMFSSLTSKGAKTTLEALSLGAVDFVAKPDSQVAELDVIRDELVAKVKAAARVRVQGARGLFHRTPVARMPEEPLDTGRSPGNATQRTRVARAVTHIVGIGTSTGGPQALESVLKALPQSIPCAIVVVQHMPPMFTRSLAERLNNICQVEVVEAHHHQPLRSGVVYIAPGGRHMEVESGRGQFYISLHDGAKRHEHRPSVDVLFESLAALSVERSLVLMTGMGNDGAVGMLQAKRSGSITIAESEETCVVYGMPKAAVTLGCVDHVLPLNQISHKIIELSS